MIHCLLFILISLNSLNKFGMWLPIIRPKKAIRMYALDRIVDLKTNDSCFEFPKKLSSEAYFNDYFGVIVIENVKKRNCYY